MGVIGKLINKILEAIFKPILTPITYISDVIEKIFNIFMSILNMGFSLIDVVMQLFDFFLKFVDIFVTLVSKITDYIFNPFKFFILLIQFVILFISFGFSFMYHTFAFPADKSSLMDLKLLEYVLYGFISSFYSFFMALYFLYWFVWKLIVEYAILHNIDKSTSGYISSFMYRYFIACENPPDAWYTTPSWHKGNQNNKYIFAFNKCPEGYSIKTNMGLFCKKNSEYEMSMCPQANLYRIDKGLGTIGELRSNYFNDNTQKYLKLKQNRKASAIEDYKQTVSSNHNTCSAQMSTKNDLIKSICMKSSVRNANYAKMKGLCFDMYCSNGKNDTMCHKLSSSGGKILDEQSNPINHLQIVFYTIFIFLFMGLVAGKVFDKQV